MVDKRALVERAGSYIAQNPREIVRAAKSIAARRVGVPLDAFRWLAGQLNGRRAPKDVEIEAVPPGLRLAATVDLMKTPVRAGATLFIDEVRVNAAELRLEVRVTDVSLEVLGDVESPVAALIRSGSLDLSRPGTLVSYLPKRSPALVESKGERFVVDLMRDPRLAKRVGRAVALVTPVLAVRSIETAPSHLDLGLEWFPEGLARALAAVREHL